MMTWWQFRCDDNHEWTVFVEDSPEPPELSVRCPYDGSEAVTAKRTAPADRVTLVLIPAARVVDRVKGSLEWEDRYFIEIVSSGAVERTRSVRHFPLTEAATKVQLFSRDSWLEALSRWRRLRLDEGAP